MYEVIKTLLEENKLILSGNHHTNATYFLTDGKKQFLKQLEEKEKKFKALERDFGELAHTIRRPIFSSMQCYDCGKEMDYYFEDGKLVPYHFEGNEFVPTGSNCFNKKEVIADISVPTGELIFINWAEHETEILGHLDNNKFETTSLQAQIQRTCNFANKGVAHFHVGSVSPTIFQKEHILLIGNGEWDDEEDAEIPLETGATDMGSCTDACWATFCDLSIYESFAIKKFGKTKGKEMTEEAAKRALITLQVEPGVYRLHYFAKPKKDYKLYAKVEKID